MTYSTPVDYEFSDAQREHYEQRFVSFNPQLVKSGILAELWRRSGQRGGGVASSILPVLMIETWPGKRRDRAQLDGAHGLPRSSPNWTPWASQSHRRTARVAGIGKDSVRVGLQMLAERGLCEFHTVPYDARFGGRRTFYRLSASLYPDDGGRFVRIPGGFLYGGHWMMLPTNAARHLYLVLSALDPVFDPESLETAMGAEEIEERRERYPVSWGALERLSGLRRSTLIEALNVLTRPIISDHNKQNPYPAYFARGEADGGHWYARTLPAWHWSAWLLNAQVAITRARRDHWPEVTERIARERRERAARSRRRRAIAYA